MEDPEVDGEHGDHDDAEHGPRHGPPDARHGALLLFGAGGLSGGVTLMWETGAPGPAPEGALGGASSRPPRDQPRRRLGKTTPPSAMRRNSTRRPGSRGRD